MSFIQLHNITKTYGKGKNVFQALHGVDLNVEQGEFVALMGPSGSGKSTMANILGCLDIATTGKYYFNGVDVFSLNRNQRALLRRHYMGFIFQGFNLLPRTSALENVELPLMYRGVNKKKRTKRALEALDMVGLTQWANHSSSELSGGQCQRVAIARAIVINPLFLLADEPTGNLDKETAMSIMQYLLHYIQKNQASLILATHDTEVANLCSHIVMLENKKLRLIR